MTENRRIALNISIGLFLSETVTADVYSLMSIEELDEHVLIWQPFENWTLEDVCKQIEYLADDIECQLIKKEI